MKKKPSGDHALAIRISKIEGGKVNLTIAQIKEVLKKLRLLEAEDKAILIKGIL